MPLCPSSSAPAGEPSSLTPERAARNPLATPGALAHLAEVLAHADAPRWNYEVGDRIRAEDLPEYGVFARALREREVSGPAPGRLVLERVRALRERVPLFRERLPQGFDPERHWAHVPSSDREDLALRPQDFADALAVEDAAPGGLLDRLIVYDTSGGTGHALRVATHPLAQAKVNALLEFVLERHGVRLDLGAGRTPCVNLAAQAGTVVFATLFGVWGNALFAKLNLHPSQWPDREAARRFLAGLAPQVITGDPVTFAEMHAWELPVRPRALVSTALDLNPALAGFLAREYGCPVIDWYSTAETGPLAYSCPLGKGLHLMSPDLHLEVLGRDGQALPPGERGEIAVTGGRNPFVALLRYRTGDTARLDRAPCACGDPLPRLLGLEGRRPVILRDGRGGGVNSVDVSRVLRRFPLVRHQVVQRADGSLAVALRPLPGAPLDCGAVRRELGELFPGVEVAVRVDAALGAESGSGKMPVFVARALGEPLPEVLALALGGPPGGE